MNYNEIVKLVADILKQFDAERPKHKQFKPGIGPFGEPQIVKVIADRLCELGVDAGTRRNPDLQIADEWAIEFKIARPFGDNGREAENWSVNLTHPYPGNTSLLGDALKLLELKGYARKGLFVIGYEHQPPRIKLDPLIRSFEIIADEVMGIGIGKRIEEIRKGLVHPDHQVLRCFGWELISWGDS